MRSSLRMTRGVAAALALGASVVASVALASPARADDGSPAEGRWFFTNQIASSEREGSLTIAAVASDAALDVRVFEHARRRGEDVAWTASGTLVGHVLTFRRDVPAPSAGIASSVEGVAPAGPFAGSALEYVAVFDEDFSKAKVRIYRLAGEEREEVGTGGLREKEPFWVRLPGDLLALSRKVYEDGLHSTVNLKKEFNVLQYVHLGVKTQVKWMRDGDRTALMKESDRQFREAGRGEPMWVRTIVTGGPTIDVGGSVPIGPVPGAALFAGIHAGATATYTVEDQSAKPEGITDVSRIERLLLDVPAHVFELPFRAASAEGLTLGARRTIEAQADVTLSAGATFGYRLADLTGKGGIATTLTVDAGASVSVYYGVRGNYRIEVEREREKLVRLRWTRVRARPFGASIAASLGLNSTADASASLGDVGQTAVSAVVAQVRRETRDYTLVSFSIGAEKLDEQRFFVELEFDLGEPDAREAYEEAVRGNFIRAQELGAAGSPAVPFGRFTSTLTDRLSFSATFRAFKVLKASMSSATTTIHAVVDDLDGRRTTTDSYLYQRSSRGIFGGRRDLLAESIERSVVRPDISAALGPERGARAAFRFTRHNAGTSRADVDATVSLAELLFGGGAVARDRERIETSRPDDRDPPSTIHRILHPDHGDEYGKSDVSLLVELDDAAIERALSASDEAFYTAYGRACVREGYDWSSQARRELLFRTPLGMKDRETEAERRLRYEAWDIRDARSALRVLSAVRGAGPTQERAEAFRRIAKIDGFEMRAVVALAVLAGDAARRELALTAEGASFSFAAGKRAEVPGEDRLPLPPR